MIPRSSSEKRPVFLRRLCSVRKSFAFASFASVVAAGLPSVLAVACSDGDARAPSNVDAAVNDTVPMADAGTGPVVVADAAPPRPIVTSCEDGVKARGISDCGLDGGDSCCDSLAVPAGTFLRDYDGVMHMATGNPATVSGFRLDRFEVTVGRFRSFVTAVAAARDGWLPAAGSGKHSHLNGGKGLAEPKGTSSTYEAGWDPAWSAHLAKTADAWSKNLSCSASYQTWTPDLAGDESLPINCASWFEAAAFCIWDGGFLPSEAEWTYAASGGADQRVYPWATPSTSTAIDCTYANFGGAMWPGSACVSSGPNRVGSEPKGNGKWGHADLGGNVWEWTTDWSSGHVLPCADCADLDLGTTARVIRGGGFSDSVSAVESSSGLGSKPEARDYTIGFRCARIP